MSANLRSELTPSKPLYERTGRLADWAARLRKINDEMEIYFGEPGPAAYPTEAEMTVNIAWRATMRELEACR